MNQSALEPQSQRSRMMRSKTPAILLAISGVAISVSSAIGVVAQATPSRSLLALSKRNHTLAIVNPSTLQVIASAPVGPDPHEVIASSDGKTAYVSIYGGGRYHTLSVIDLVRQKALPDIDTGALNGPHGLAFAGEKVWFTAEGAKAVATYDPVSAKIDWIMGTGQNRTHMIYVTPNEKRIYTTNVSSATVSILEKVTLPPMSPPPGMPQPQGSMPPPPPPGGNQPRMDWNETVIPVGKGDEGFDVSPVGGFIDGEGKIVSTTTGALPELEVTWQSRVDDEQSLTSPEELLAAAHASCFAMQFTSGLVGAGWEPEEMQVSCEVTFEIGMGITGSALTARVTVDGLTDEQVYEIAQRAKIMCPISRALAGIDITLELPDLVLEGDEGEAEVGDADVEAGEASSATDE